MNSSNEKGRRTLAGTTSSHAEEFLLELANINDDAAAIARFQKKFDTWIPVQLDAFVGVEVLPFGERVDPTDPASRAARSHARREMIVTALKTRRYAPKSSREPIATAPTVSSPE